MRFQRVDDWLAWLETLHPRAIDPGLERIGEVAARMGLNRPPVPVVTVAGTNGKGSTVAAVTALAGAAGHSTGAYTSPHLLAFNERIAIDGEPVSDDRLLAAFDAIDRARGEVTLSYFEFATLAALWCFREAGCDLWVLEVGLGGRLDATNVLAPTVAVITSVGLDHTEWLGEDREAIGTEKAGILRPGTPLVLADPDPPTSVLAAAAAQDCPVERIGETFRAVTATPGADHWRYEDASGALDAIPRPDCMPAALLANPAAAVAALRRLGDSWLPDTATAAAVLGAATAPARFQRLERAVPWYVDVAHNHDGARALGERLRAGAGPGRTHAVFAIMSRKDAGGVVAALHDAVDVWHVLALDDPSARRSEDLIALIREAGGRVGRCAPVDTLMRELDGSLGPGDRVIAFGSFRVAEDVLRAHRRLLP
ncbi:bifunctional folylpolyglutamate synthase/dihydrofolate synthase [Arhodomonas aquaeolei]|uniref:bifunctional folylpolyglutamate synthase/dihydrofolate synthase n=1 Tax=Arhodomonas aquaeolei TaxID=2369 RepID=UPI0003624FAB|nr:folylpolyglutamate synthase/dihydrofolate synthase family protein [Arhodomonas aquaeolei]